MIKLKKIVITRAYVSTMTTQHVKHPTTLTLLLQIKTNHVYKWKGTNLTIILMCNKNEIPQKLWFKWKKVQPIWHIEFKVWEGAQEI